MDFAEVVRRRRMVRTYDPTGRCRRRWSTRCRARAARAVGGFSQGWGFLVLTEPADRRSLLVGRPRRARRRPGEATGWTGMRTAPVIVVCLPTSRSTWTGTPSPTRAGPTGRGPLAGAVLAHRHRDGGAADAAQRGRRGARRLLLRHPAGADAAFRTAFGVPEEFTPIGAITIGYRAADTRSPSLKRGRRESRPVAHRGHWWRQRPMVTTLGVGLSHRVGTTGSVEGGKRRRDLQSGPGRSRLTPNIGLTLKQWAEIPPRPVRLDQLITTKRELALDKLLAEDSTFYGDLFPHVVQWQNGSVSGGRAAPRAARGTAAAHPDPRESPAA